PVHVVRPAPPSPTPVAMPSRKQTGAGDAGIWPEPNLRITRLSTFRPVMAVAKVFTPALVTLSCPGICVTCALVPRTIVLLVETTAFVPIATELLTCVVEFGLPLLNPMKTLSLPVVLSLPALSPKNELLLPVVEAKPAPVPTNVFEFPVVLVKPVPVPPKNELRIPLVVLKPAFTLKNELAPPTSVFSPACAPTNVFRLLLFFSPA